MNYKDWNFYLREHFFNPEMAGREVILFVDDSLINQIGAPHNADVNDFIAAIKKGPAWSTKITVPQKAYEAYERGSRVNPQYVAYLAFFVIAAVTEGEFSYNAYYPRINQLLGDTANPITTANFQKMRELWEALETWTKEEMFESVGRFTARIRGNWVHVGMPWSQTLLTSEERGNLPVIFAEYGFDPTSPPAENVIAQALLQSSVLLVRSRRVIKNQEMGGGYFRQSLLDLVLADLRDWNGEVPIDTVDVGERNTRVCGSIRICLDYDHLSQQVHTTLRFKANRDLPEEEMCYTRQKDNSQWVCSSSIETWTTEFHSPNTKELLDASKLDWNQGEEFSDETNQWIVHLRPSEIKPFMVGTKEGLAKWVETNRIQPGERYLLAVSSHKKEEISKWGTECCQSFKELRVFEGLPAGWYLYEFSNATKSHSVIGVLQLPMTISIHFVGGIKTRLGNKYFPFALPRIAVEGFSGGKILVNGREIKKDKDEFWSVPEDLPKEQPILVEVPFGDLVIKSSFQIEESNFSQEYSRLSRDRFGKIQDCASPHCSISGAVVEGNITSYIPPFRPVLPTFLASRMIFLGRVPGEVYEWPRDGLQKEWEPVWAIIKLRRDKYQAIYVGSNYEAPYLKGATRLQHWKKWKRAFLYRDILTPQLRSLATLWTVYKKEAKKL